MDPARCLPARGETHLWYGGHDEPGAEPHRDLEVLSADERHRCARFSGRADRARYAAAWAGVRRVLAGYLGGSPAALRFEHHGPFEGGEQRRQPYLRTGEGAALRISVARSEGRWLLALAVGDPVGVDLEHLRDFDTAGLIERCLAPEERRRVNSLPAAERGDAFLRAWTRKEALMKAAALPRGTAPHRLPVHPTRYGPVPVGLPGEPPQGPPGWTVRDLVLPSAAERAALARPLHCTGPVRWHDLAATGPPATGGPAAAARHFAAATEKAAAPGA
ncbi:4'-phosphopantetheinyl transferase superfamily protein [Kitasatospora nipponensis]|uniref:4'-phosphopantetheinyl transferase superfamily protein n=1 Tax=Kitasatospora nipponensis TaxID=258049 RepID=A0ABN1VZF7_9ACTN